MNKRVACFLALCLSMVLLVTSCQNGDRAIIPVTGKKVVPVQVELAHNNVLEYVISSSRVANIPPKTDWELADEQVEGEYRFSSGNWLMTVWSQGTQEENQRVIISNKTEHALWCGYVEPDGHVVDTAYIR